MRVCSFVLKVIGLVNRMLNCKEVSKLVSKSKEQKLGLWERFMLRMHIWICGPCTEYEKNSSYLSSAMREYAKQDRQPEKEES